MPPHYIMLIFAIITETIGMAALQASQQFSKFLPATICVISYAVSFYLMALALKVIPVGIAYALWSGIGIVMIAIIGFMVFGQRLDFAAVAGMGLIIVGILIIHLFSGSATH